jgi:hypothetical protein
MTTETITMSRADAEKVRVSLSNLIEDGDKTDKEQGKIALSIINSALGRE